MVCLKQRRAEAGLTQQQLAEGLGTTQQTIARWETGKTAIPSPVLKDLAIILNCTIEDILGTSTKRRSFYGRALTKQLKSRPEAVNLYGGLRLTIEGVGEQLEFPIDEETYKFVDRFFSDSLEKEKPEWLFLDTMDNWLLLINLKRLTSLETYDDDAQASPLFDHPEVYKALTSRLELEEQELSESLLNYCQEKTNEFEDREESWSYYNEAQIYTQTQQRYKVFLDEKNAWQLHEFEILVDGLDKNSPIFLRFENEETGGILVLNLNQLSLIKIPAAAYQILNEEDDNEKE
ncbi:MAG: helix-turn-helix transcriptional regulator [Oculatellaceae cyanobacterium Prado106]|jgi:transcriptional regulator with XRE-family HTH domain|nr:helix-turn-helix transcriptional regulator [Oculatellaceae cyanobacterium Prado106]